MYQYLELKDKQKIMPIPEDGLPLRGQPLPYKEAVQLIYPVNPELKGEIRRTSSIERGDQGDYVVGYVNLHSGVRLPPCQLLHFMDMTSTSELTMPEQNLNLMESTGREDLVLFFCT